MNENAPRQEVSRVSGSGASLTFCAPTVDALAAACTDLLGGGPGAVVLTPAGPIAGQVRARIAAHAARAGVRVLVDDVATAMSSPAHGEAHRVPSVVVVCALDESVVSDTLLQLVDSDVAVVAVETRRLWSRLPLFLISIPKAGTHLLYSLVEAMGYAPAVVLQGDPAPGHWYCVEYSNSHTTARDFFVDTVRRSPFGNRHHPFMRSPAVFIYRNPLDVVASEASYYHQPTKTAFAGYLSALTPAERLGRLIDDPWLLGSIRDRVGAFIPWLELPNVIPVSFEELIGERGGGSTEAQRRAVWSIQLRLHVPGDPARLAAGIFQEDSPTFDAARIGRHRELFDQDAYRRFFSLDQDFMSAYGFAAPDGTTQLPQRAAEFRHRPLGLLEARPEIPIMVEHGYLGYNIVLVDGRYVVVHQSAGDLTLSAENLDALASANRITVADTLEHARRAAEALVIRHELARLDAEKSTVAPDATLIRERSDGFNIVRVGARYWAVAQRLGPIDFARADLRPLLESGDVMVADTPEAADMLAFQAGRRVEQEAASARLSQELADAAGRLRGLEDERQGLLESLDAERRASTAERQRREKLEIDGERTASELRHEIEALRQRLGEERRLLAAERDGRAADRRELADERDARAADLRELAAERDGRAADRRELADERDARAADLRELAAERDGRAADLRELAAEQAAHLESLEAWQRESQRSDAHRTEADRIRAGLDQRIEQLSMLAAQKESELMRRAMEVEELRAWAFHVHTELASARRVRSGRVRRLLGRWSAGSRSTLDTKT
jgi:hypothetical protein